MASATITGTLLAGSIISNGAIVGDTGTSVFNQDDVNGVGSSWNVYLDNNRTKKLAQIYLAQQTSYTNYGRVYLAAKTPTGTAGKIILNGYSTGTESATDTPAVDISGNHIKLKANSEGKLDGTWKGTNSMTIDSDINLKHNITDISSQYAILFDNLRPVTYKYNNGTSDRLHTGFIAQEVGNALDIANINSQNFAGLVVYNRKTEDEIWTLRYEEFIALNTWQIQKLKARVAELE